MSRFDETSYFPKGEIMVKIDKDMTFKEVLEAYPETIEIFDKYNMGCLSCTGAINETLEQGAISHGLDVEILLNELNEVID